MRGSHGRARAVHFLAAVALALFTSFYFFTELAPPPLPAAPAVSLTAARAPTAPQPEGAAAPAPAALPPPSPSTFHSLVIVFAHTAPDAIGYAGTLPSSPAHCIHPPPFGEQCTAMADASLRACLALPGCAALTCPDPAPYHAPHPRLPRAGPVCQARTVRSAAAWRRGGEDLEAGHGMCTPTGCTSFFLARLGAGDLAAPLARALSAALRARGLQHHDTLLAWGGAGGAGASAEQRQLLAADALLPLTVLQAGSSGSGSGGAWLVDAGAAAAPLLREQLGVPPAGLDLPWASLNSSLAVFLL
jgi:hypothetical protein